MAQGEQLKRSVSSWLRSFMWDLQITFQWHGATWPAKAPSPASPFTFPPCPHLAVTSCQRTRNSSSNPPWWLTAQQALYQNMKMVFYRPAVDCYQPEKQKSMSERWSINYGWNVTAVKLHTERRLSEAFTLPNIPQYHGGLRLGTDCSSVLSRPLKQYHFTALCNGFLELN